MSHTIFDHGNSDGVVHRSELIFLWTMLEGIHLDIGSHFVRHLAKVGKASAENIVIGGLITLIALALGYELTGMQEAMGNTRIDLESCIVIRMII